MFPDVKILAVDIFNDAPESAKIKNLQIFTLALTKVFNSISIAPKIDIDWKEFCNKCHFKGNFSVSVKR